MFTFRDKVVLITGGSSGIGRAAALRIADDGGQVAIAARHLDALEAVATEARSVGPAMLPVEADVCDPEQCRRAVQTTVERFGKLDILIASAGLSMRCYFEGTDLAAMRDVVNVNFLGTLNVTHFALPHVKKSRGSLVAVSSLTGLRGVPSYSIYGASKFAIHGLYESLRLELRGDGVHVGVLYPGFVDTPLRTKVLNSDGKPWDHPPEPPFIIWPVEKCVDRLIRLIARRKARALLPWRAGPALALDNLVGRWIGDWVLERKFPPL
jgi:NAD(P)-dependent dehydrogenase (short-subunit alcohol dehydrogenase family)